MRKIKLFTPIIASAALILFGVSAGAASAAPVDTPATTATTTSSLAISQPAAPAWLRGVPDSRDF
jgi:hypothetical protein